MAHNDHTEQVNDPWLPILNHLPLSRSERAVVERYAGNPLGRTFLPIADILLSHNLVSECIELLMNGVARHPKFTVARVILARELFNRGMIAQAWQVLEESPDPLHENVLAQKIRFKLAVLLEREVTAREVYKYILQRRMFDDDIKRIGDIFDEQGIKAAAAALRSDLHKNGVTVIDTALAAQPQPVGASAIPLADIGDEMADTLDPLAGFQVLPLREVFQLAFAREKNRERGMSESEMDSTTLAEIYESQGHFQKALDVYQRLYRLSPSNEHIRRKMAEVAKLREAQKQDERELDPSFAEQMESIEIINTQIRFLNELLVRVH